MFSMDMLTIDYVENVEMTLNFHCKHSVLTMKYTHLSVFIYYNNNLYSVTNIQFKCSVQELLLRKMPVLRVP